MLTLALDTANDRVAVALAGDGRETVRAEAISRGHAERLFPLFDEVLTIAGPEAMKASLALAQNEGIFVGITAGGTFAAALKVAESAPAGANILCMLPDTGERYLSTPLFADVPADMTEEEVQISLSTPGQHLPPKPAA